MKDMKNTKTSIIIIISIMMFVGSINLTAVLKQHQLNAAGLTQHSKLLNNCYRSNKCRDSTVGQNSLGNDNSATGFADQSDNLQQFTTANRTTPTHIPPPTSILTPTPTPTPTPILQPSFSNPVPLDNSPGDQTDPHIASSGSSIYAVWTSQVNGQSFISFARSTDGGATFNTPIPLSDPPNSFSFLPDVAVDKNNNNVYVEWTRVTTLSEVVIVKSTDGGVSFGPPIVLNPGPLANGRSGVVAVDGNRVYVTWQEVNPNGIESDTLFAASTDGGANFSNPIDISNNPGTVSKNPSIAAFGSNVYVAWQDCDQTGTNCKILYTKSSNAGLGFTSPVVLSGPESIVPDIKVFENNVYLVYGQAYPVNSVIRRDVFLLKSTDGGQNFASPVNLSISIPDSTSQNPNIDVSGNNVAITWEERMTSAANSHFEIFFVGSIDAGNILSDPISISSSLGNVNSILNDVAISGTNVYSIWTAFNNGSFNIYFVKGNLTPS
jgi:hypothetical protein